jgi:AraC-like DNA-binding protein
MLEKQSLWDAADKAEEIWTTDSVPEPEREEYWRAALRHLYPDLTTVEQFDADSVCGRLVVRSFADGRASECQQSAARLIGAGADPAGDGWDGYNLILQIDGVGRVSHAGRTFHRRFGEMMLTDATLPFEEVGLDNPHVQVWSLPRHRLEPLLIAPDLSIGLGIDSRHGAGALLLSLLQTTWRECGGLARPLQHRIQDSICRFVALAFGPTSSAQKSGRNGSGHASLPEACAYIESRLQDPRLNVGEVAEWLCLSRRKLEMLFEETGIGVAGWIRRRRIEECRKMLADPAWGHLSITEVALTWGFRDLSTFNRRFRAQCGMAPRELRRGRHIVSQGLEPEAPPAWTIGP